MDGSDITLRLGKDEALVLFELLADFYDQAELSIPSNAERLALVRLHGRLEATLEETFRPDYTTFIDAARERLKSQF